MATTSAQITVATTPTRLDTAGMDESVDVFNVGPAVVFLGGTTVTTANGLQFPVGATHSGRYGDLEGVALYAVVASGTGLVHVLRTV